MNPQPEEAHENIDVASLLDEAESLLMQDMDDDLKMLEQDPFSLNVNTEKYEKARPIFEQVLSIDPDNERARTGLDACDVMLDVYIPVQYIVPPPPPGIHVTIPENQEYTDTKRIEKEPDVPKADNLKPWEVRRIKMQELRARDRAGMKFTGQVFSEEREIAEKEVRQILETARDEVENGGMDPGVVYLEKLQILRDMQERLNSIWKGHGPEILETGQEKLRKVLGF